MKLGIIGTGKIVEDALFAIEPLENIFVNAIFARTHSLQKGEALAKRYAINSIYTDYNELLTQADIDTVYIGLINSVHYEYAKKALEQNKNVILEKPFTGTLEEAENLINLSKKQGCFIFEAITVLHNDIIEKMRATLPKLGNIRMMTANYSQYSSRYDNYLAGKVEHTFDPAHLGGALRDINIYNIHYAVALFGTPQHVKYYPNRGFNGIDTSGVLIMEYEGFSCVCIAAKDSDSPCFVSVQGEKGFMKINGKPNVAPNLEIVIAGENNLNQARDLAGAVVRSTAIENFIPEKSHHRMTKEFKDFAEIIDGKKTAEAEKYIRETFEVMKVITNCQNF